MDPEASQLATQPYGTDGLLSGLVDSQEPEDLADILAFLHPSSPEAMEVVEQCRATAPQHVLGGGSLAGAMDGLAGEPRENSQAPGNGIEDGDSPTQPHEHPARSSPPEAIVLRLSSQVKDIASGFVFGRNGAKSDILIKPNHPRIKVSGVHFRIYLNEAGILMIADSSTNGTFVDKVCLKYKDGPLKSGRVLEHGAKIEVITCTDAATQISKKVTFFVDLPNRSSAELKQRFQENVNLHLARKAMAVNKDNANGAAAAAAVSLRDGLVGVGSARFTHGMRWDGGEKYIVLETIGKGTFAIVYKIATRAEGEVFAAKEISKVRVPNGSHFDQKIENEIQIMKKLTHPHVLALKDSHDHGSHLYLILEYMPGGELSRYLHHRETMSEELGRSITRQLCQALGYIHSQNITHRDVKPENVLIRSENPMWIKLSDFGLSKMIEDEGMHVLATFCGTLLYCAPEVYPEYEERIGLQRYSKNSALPLAKYTSKVDIWSLAAVMFHVLVKEPAYHPNSRRDGEEPQPSPPQPASRQMFNNIMAPDLVSWNLLSRAGYSSSALEFLKSMLKINPSARPTALQCLGHSWLQDVPDVSPDLPLLKQDESAESFGSWAYSDNFLLNHADIYTARASPATEVEPQRFPAHLNGNGLAARPRLFGEVNEIGRADSDLLGAASIKILRRFDTDNSVSSGIAVPEDESALQSTVSQIEDLTVDSPKPFQSVAQSASFLKRAREEFDRFDNNPTASKRLMGFNGSRASPRLVAGRLVPVDGSVADATTLELTDHISVWGRWEQASHQWPNPKDTRIPRSGMDIIFWAPDIIRDGVVRADWAALAEVNAYIKTRSSLGIRVDGELLPRQNGHSNDVYGKLRTGDVVQIFSDRSDMLAYRCEFYIGESCQERQAGEKITLEKMPEIWDYFGSTLKPR